MPTTPSSTYCKSLQLLLLRLLIGTVVLVTNGLRWVTQQRIGDVMDWLWRISYYCLWEELPEWFYPSQRRQQQQFRRPTHRHGDAVHGVNDDELNRSDRQWEHQQQHPNTTATNSQLQLHYNNINNMTIGIMEDHQDFLRVTRTGKHSLSIELLDGGLCLDDDDDDDDDIVLSSLTTSGSSSSRTRTILQQAIQQAIASSSADHHHHDGDTTNTSTTTTTPANDDPDCPDGPAGAPNSKNMIRIHKLDLFASHFRATLTAKMVGLILQSLQQQQETVVTTTTTTTTTTATTVVVPLEHVQLGGVLLSVDELCKILQLPLLAQSLTHLALYDLEFTATRTGTTPEATNPPATNPSAATTSRPHQQLLLLALQEVAAIFLRLEDEHVTLDPFFTFLQDRAPRLRHLELVLDHNHAYVHGYPRQLLQQQHDNDGVVVAGAAAAVQNDVVGGAVAEILADQPPQAQLLPPPLQEQEQQQQRQQQLFQTQPQRHENRHLFSPIALANLLQATSNHLETIILEYVPLAAPHFVALANHALSLKHLRLRDEPDTTSTGILKLPLPGTTTTTTTTMMMDDCRAKALALVLRRCSSLEIVSLDGILSQPNDIAIVVCQGLKHNNNNNNINTASKINSLRLRSMPLHLDSLTTLLSGNTTLQYLSLHNLTYYHDVTPPTKNHHHHRHNHHSNISSTENEQSVLGYPNNMNPEELVLAKLVTILKDHNNAALRRISWKQTEFRRTEIFPRRQKPKTYRCYQHQHQQNQTQSTISHPRFTAQQQLHWYLTLNQRGIRNLMVDVNRTREEYLRLMLEQQEQRQQVKWQQQLQKLSLESLRATADNKENSSNHDDEVSGYELDCLYFMVSNNPSLCA